MRLRRGRPLAARTAEGEGSRASAGTAATRARIVRWAWPSGRRPPAPPARAEARRLRGRLQGACLAAAGGRGGAGASARQRRPSSPGRGPGAA
eukprot:12354007-Alexandrium_andersonii.AAC.1